MLRKSDSENMKEIKKLWKPDSRCRSINLKTSHQPVLTVLLCVKKKNLSQSGVPSKLQASHQIRTHAPSWTPTNRRAKGQPRSKRKYISEKVLTPPVWPPVQKGQRRDPSPTEPFIYSFWPASWSDLNMQWRARELSGENIIKAKVKNGDDIRLISHPARRWPSPCRTTQIKVCWES